MCGIAGVVDALASAEERTNAVARMCAAMVHRGPDDSGIETSGPATLGMQRLAIFDPVHGHQPMASPDGRFSLIFNGAIYNFRELRTQLAAQGWAFRSECDTEVLLAAFATWGAKCLDRLRGMFAFAAWDKRENTLFVARDPFGIKPLYYGHDGTRFVFASELNALFASGLVRSEIDPTSVADYLGWFAVPAPRTIYRNVYSLRPGECATLHDGRLEIRTAWSFSTIPTGTPAARTRPEFLQQLRSKLEDTIRAHTLADVPVGAFLSGGLDSAAVVGLMARHGGGRLRTFSIDFEESEFSEAGFAAETARHFGTEHQAKVLTGAEVVRDLDRLLAAFDQPSGDGINTYYASQAARAGGVTVALSGLGGDELFGGYPVFSDVPRLQRWLPAWRRLPGKARTFVTKRLAQGDTRQRKLGDFLEHATNLHEMGALQRRVFSESARRVLLSTDTRRATGFRPPFHPELAALSADVPLADSFEIVSAWELRTYMADVLLRDSDVMSMRHSLELRVPLVDRPLIEWLWRQPAKFKSDSTQNKSALRDALADILPPGLTGRPKRGFSLPFALWMKRELRPFLEDTFADGSVDRSGFFSRTGVQQMWQGFVAGNDPREWSRLWSLATLINFINRRTPAPVPASHRMKPSVSIGSQPAMSAAARVNGTTPPVPAAASKSKERAAVRSRTLLLAPEIFGSEGGIPRILQLYLKALCEIDDAPSAVRLLALNDEAVDSTDLRRCANGRLEDWYVCSRSRSRFVRAALRMSRGCDRIICGHLFQLPVAWMARRLNPKLKYYLVAHGIEVWRPFTLRERIALRGAEKVLCVSDFTRREVLKNCPLPEGRAVVLYNGLDPYFEIDGGRPLADCPPVILVVTRLTSTERYKGVQHMIEAMPAVRAAIPDAKLRIVGRGDDLPRLQGLRHQLGLGTSVEFTGFIDDRRLAEEMRGCRLFALPSRKEGFGLVFLEAMAHGRPCLGARAGGIPEVISEDTGMLVEYGDIAGISAACIAALRRTWDPAAITARAQYFSYSPFKDRLTKVLAA